MPLTRANAPWYATGFIAVALMMLSIAAFLSLGEWESRASAAWPHVPGTVVASYSRHSCGGSRGGRSWEALITYRYVVNGRGHEASRVGTSRIFCDSDRHEVADFLRINYPVGRSVEVYYNPSDQDAAFLVPGAVSLPMLVLVAVLLGFSGVLAWGAWRSLRLVE